MCGMKKHIYTLLIALSVLFIADHIASAVFNAPSSAPPSGNVEVPVHTGSASQDKSGFFSFEGGGTRSDTFLAVLTTGRVGIGTVTPQQKLDVTGQIHATGDICTDTGGGVCLGSSGNQSLSISGNTLSISGGNSITLGSGVAGCQICLQCNPNGGAWGGAEVCVGVNAGWSAFTGDTSANGSPGDDNDACRIRMQC